MSATVSRRFPPAPGPLGWVGVALMVAGMACQLGAGTVPPSSISKENQRRMVRASAVMGAAGLLGVGGFIVVLLTFHGDRRLPIATVPLLLSGIVEHAALVEIADAGGRPGPRLFGRCGRRGVVVFTILSLIGAAVLLAAGLFWVPN